MLPHNPYLVNLIEIFDEDGYRYLIYEYCEGGTVYEKLKIRRFSE